jgi:hypothetical protein
MKTFLAFALLFAAVVGLQVVSVIAIQYFIPDWSTRAQFGDSFGAVNSLFSGLAFAGLIYTIFLQRGELQLQREELQLTRSELTRSAEAQEKSERALAKQAFAAQAAAEIAAINNILAYVDGETKRMSASDTVRIVNREALDRFAIQRSNLIKNLNQIYSNSVAERFGS